MSKKRAPTSPELQILRLTKDAVPTAQIANTVGCSRSTVFRVRREFKTPSKIRPGGAYRKGIYQNDKALQEDEIDEHEAIPPVVRIANRAHANAQNILLGRNNK